MSRANESGDSWNTCPEVELLGGERCTCETGFHNMMFPIIEYTEFVPVLIVPKKTMELTRFTFDRRTMFGIETSTEEVKYVPKCYWGEVLKVKSDDRLNGYLFHSAPEYCI